MKNKQSAATSTEQAKQTLVMSGHEPETPKLQLLHPYMTTGKTVALTIWTFVGKVMSLLFNTLSGYVLAFLPRSKYLLIS